MTRPPARVLADATLDVPSVPAGSRRALLLNPPVYDAQYWARWSQPAGLLRLGRMMRDRGYDVRLLDAMETDARGYVPKSRRKVGGVPQVVRRDDMAKPIYHFGLGWDAIRARLTALFPEAPDEVWITSVMTYWWESTRDAVALCRELFPHATVLVGGIYPTVAPAHAAAKLGADVVFTGELHAASDCWPDFSLYERAPSYAIVTTSRGCPWDCHYCAARTLNGGSNKVRARDPDDVLAEIREKYDKYGVRRFGFYEDNALVSRGHLQEVLERIIESGMKLDLYAPEGFETRFLTTDLLKVMKRAGFDRIHLPFEALKFETTLGWNRRHASTASFEAAFEAAVEAGFKPRSEDINAFVLFGLPDDSLADILDGVLYVHHKVGSIVPMLFTPVPGTHIYREHEQYLLREPKRDPDGGQRLWDLQDLNGKFLPFLEYNRRRYPELRASDYLQLEALMSVLNNGKVLWRAADLCDDALASRGFRTAVGEIRPPKQRRTVA
ncbi:MAG TPA: B12-binding domain-containing radical SAM protein [Chloroflexota bacterium]|nr:B12-binding domain-containing radical SAM protein [Chloroflexota bacterium]